jgi:phasin family protein
MDQPTTEAVTEASTDRREEAAPRVAPRAKRVSTRRAKTERKPRALKVADSAPVVKTPRVKRAKAATPAPAVAATPVSKDIPVQFDPTNWMKSFTNMPTFGATPAFGTAPSFPTLPGSDGLQAMFADAGSRGQQALERTRTVAEEMTAMARANMEALTETGRIAAAGVKSLSETVLERSRGGLEQAAAEVKTLTEAQSPSEFFQRHGELTRTAFDRAVAEGSRFTETLVKLAGEAMQPLSSQAAVNAEKLNTIAA